MKVGLENQVELVDNVQFVSTEAALVLLLVKHKCLKRSLVFHLKGSVVVYSVVGHHGACLDCELFHWMLKEAFGMKRHCQAVKLLVDYCYGGLQMVHSVLHLSATVW